MQVDAVWGDFYQQVQQSTGLDLTQYKQNQLQRRILALAERKGTGGLAELARHISASAESRQAFVDKVAVNVSELFRNPEKWEELVERELPDLLSRSSCLKCWSAGCSFGAEAYTLSLCFREWFEGDHTIRGTDIDQAALAQAKAGTFNDSDMRGVSSTYCNRYFESKDGRHVAKRELRKGLSFHRGDLLSDSFDVDYDLILCRNVVIYFNEEAKDALYRKFYRALKPGGVLFIGSTERIVNGKEIGFDSPSPFFYRKPIQGGQVWRNAS